MEITSKGWKYDEWETCYMALKSWQIIFNFSNNIKFLTFQSKLIPLDNEYIESVHLDIDAGRITNSTTLVIDTLILILVG